ncbi:MAG: WG repeat-containing protein [Pseudomonadota bacterium]|nr:WG repeat-containing protein [Pseudomonadota bacterium]
MVETLKGIVCAVGIGGMVGGAYAASPRLWPIEVDGKHGAIDRRGKLVVEPQYDSAIEFAGGMARVSQNGKTGFIDATGRLAISPKKSLSRGSGDFAAEISIAALISPEFSEGLAVFRLDDREGYVDVNGDIVIAAQFDQAFPFYDGLAVVRVGSKFGWIDRSGEVVIAATYDKVQPFTDGLACVLVYDKGGYGYIDRKGQWAIAAQFNYAYPFVEARARAQVKGGYAYIDTTGKTVVPPSSDYKLSTDFSNGRAAFRLDAGWGYLDPSGAVAIAPIFFGGYAFREGMARATLTGGMSPEGKRTQKLFGYVGLDGKFVVKPQFDDAGDFNEGRAGVSVDGKYGFIDAQGKLRIEPRYAGVENFSDGLARVWIQTAGRGKHAYVDPDGHEVWTSP